MNEHNLSTNLLRHFLFQWILMVAYVGPTSSLPLDKPHVPQVVFYRKFADLDQWRCLKPPYDPK
ncbi:hypothetical protein ACTXT7_006782 [Hymenolepis weldensis]